MSDNEIILNIVIVVFAASFGWIIGLLLAYWLAPNGVWIKRGRAGEIIKRVYYSFESESPGRLKR